MNLKTIVEFCVTFAPLITAIGVFFALVFGVIMLSDPITKLVTAFQNGLSNRGNSKDIRLRKIYLHTLCQYVKPSFGGDEKLYRYACQQITTEINQSVTVHALTVHEFLYKPLDVVGHWMSLSQFLESYNIKVPESPLEFYHRLSEEFIKHGYEDQKKSIVHRISFNS